jgi:iron complex transport system permease protein
MITLSYRNIVALVTVGIVILAVIGIQLGAVTLPLGSVVAVFKSKLLGLDVSAELSHAQERVIWGFRLPRVIFAMVVGAGLALSGTVLQAVTRNVLADPYLFGLSSGASLGAVLVLGLGIASSAMLPLAAFIGGVLAMILVLAIAGNRCTPTSDNLVLAGVAVAFLLSAGVNFVLYTSDYNAAQSVLFWMLGALGGARWSMLTVPVLVVAVSFVILQLHARKLDALIMGEETAETLGVDVRKVRFGCLVLATLVTATLVAYAGTIGFVGLVIPHICRGFVGGAHARLLPVCCLVGAGFMVCVDIIARTSFAPMELPIGIVTAGIGGTYFLYLLRRRVG